ncbi:hypothetical protein IW262DRAFT_1412148 [Armillaria fumosa]|nr:hypothetical protein IW262DRAFT_1412148 [Armillaria fumosa]
MILRGLKHHNELAQKNAITFLYRVCARNLNQGQSESSSGGSDLALNLSELLGNIVKLGKKNTKQSKSEALGTVRKALRVFCRYETFKDRLLDPTVLAVISKDINVETANMRYGHGVYAQIYGVECWQELMKYDRVRVETYEKGLVIDLLNLYSALQEEAESCQWLRLWPDYSRLLKETLEDLVDDGYLFTERALNSSLYERLRPFILQLPLLKRYRPTRPDMEPL